MDNLMFGKLKIPVLAVAMILLSGFAFRAQASSVPAGDEVADVADVADVAAETAAEVSDSGSVIGEKEEKKEAIDVQKMIFGHLLDSYSWEICVIGDKEIALHLPVILYSKTSGWHIFSSGKIGHGGGYEGFYPAPAGSPHEGKLMELMPDGSYVRPVDLSITKMAMALIINSILLLVIFLPAASWFRKHKDGKGVPGKYAAFVEYMVTSVEDSVIKPCVGEDYRRYSPYLLTAFFFIFICNLLALVPLFPAGVGVTANIAVTMFLALCTFVAVNVFGTKEYWKEILWPDMPLLLKAPLPIMPMIELFGILTKPIALMVRLFANMLSGHMAMLVLTALIFIGFNTSVAMGGSMTLLSVVFNVFMNMLELLVAFIQAYVFTLLSAVFIGQSRVRHH